MTTPTPDDDGQRTRPFADLLRELDKGRVHSELSEKLQELIEAVMDVRKPGTIQLTVKVVAAKGDAMAEVSSTVAVKIPRVARTSIFFVTDDANLSRTNPDQPYLPLSGVPGDGDTTSTTVEQTRSAR